MLMTLQSQQFKKITIGIWTMTLTVINVDDGFDFHDFYTIKFLWEGDFGVKITKFLSNILGFIQGREISYMYDQSSFFSLGQKKFLWSFWNHLLVSLVTFKFFWGSLKIIENTEFLTHMLHKSLAPGGSPGWPQRPEFSGMGECKRYTVKKTGRKINRCLEFLSQRQFFPSVSYKIYARHHCLFLKS